MKVRLVLMTFLIPFSLSLFAEESIPCEGIQGDKEVVIESKYFKTQYTCREGILVDKKKYSTKYDALLSHKQYDDLGRLISGRSFDSKGSMTRWFEREWLDTDRFREKSYHVLAQTKTLARQSEYKIEAKEEKLIKKWHYRRLNPKDQTNPRYELERIDRYNDLKQIVAREIVSSPYGHNGHTFYFEQPDNIDKFGFIKSFEVRDSYEVLIGHYQVNNSNPLQIIKDTMKDDGDKLAIFQSFRRKVAIIDTGFSYGHPDIAYKLEVNANDPIDGYDNDGNGIVDDAFGFYVNDDGSLSANIQERAIVKENDRLSIPFSHGVHVTSLALKDIDSFSWSGYGGDMSNIDYLNLLSTTLAQQGIEFANMSFGFGDRRNPMAPNSRAFNALSNLIRDNDQTLFFVAAGNSNQNIDGDVREYPAAFQYNNILTVGALNVSAINWSDPVSLSTLDRAHFSNFGTMNVDIFDSGTRVVGANIGQTYVPASGTSMASPVAMNSALKIAERYPSLSGAEIKKILLYSAFIPNLEQPLPCRSGGVVDIERAFSLAQLVVTQLKTQNKINYMKLAWQARSKVRRAGENLSADTMDLLKSIWNQI